MIVWQTTCGRDVKLGTESSEVDPTAAQCPGVGLRCAGGWRMG